jgi:hypothetical protein
MTLRRQTHLGPTGTKSLTIIDLPPSSLPSSGKNKSTATWSQTSKRATAKKPYIFQLSDELLVLIVELVANGPCSRSRVFHLRHTAACNNGIISIISRICHRLRRVAQPALFRNICIESPNATVPPSKPIIKLHRTLRGRADLQQHCR